MNQDNNIESFGLNSSIKPDLVSVILPCYNVAAYLPKAVECLMNQTYHQVEIILVDDGSDDGLTNMLCDKFDKNFDNVTTLHKKNGGLSSARNYGLVHAHGEFIVFYDPDDRMEPDMIERAVTVAKKWSADLVIWGYYMEIQKNGCCSKQIPYTLKKDEVYLDHNEIVKNLIRLTDQSLFYNAWNKLYRHNIIRQNGLQYRAMPSAEDVEFNLQYIRFSTRMVCLANCLYHYVRERMGNLSTSYRPNWFELRKNEHALFVDAYSNLGIDSYESKEFLARHFSERVLGCIENEFSKANNEYEKMSKALNPYGDGKASQRIADILCYGKIKCNNN